MVRPNGRSDRWQLFFQFSLNKKIKIYPSAPVVKAERAHYARTFWADSEKMGFPSQKFDGVVMDDVAKCKWIDIKSMIIEIVHVSNYLQKRIDRFKELLNP